MKKGSKHSEETKRKMSEARRKRRSGALGKHWKLSKKTKRKLSEIHRGLKCSTE